MLVVSNMVVKHSHLTTTDTSTHVTHAIVVADSSMLIVRISITSLSSIPHHLVGFILVAANQGATTRRGNHLIAVKRQHTILAKCAKHLTIEARAHALCCIFHHGNAILIGNRHNLIDAVRHTIESHRHNRLRIFSRFLLTVNDSLLKQCWIHVPCFTLRTYEHWLCSEICDWMTRSAECETLHQYFITSLHATANQSQVNGSSTSRQTNHLTVKRLCTITLTVGKRLQILLEGIYIRSHRHHPVSVERFLHIFLFNSSLAHVSKTKINHLSFFHFYIKFRISFFYTMIPLDFQ